MGPPRLSFSDSATLNNPRSSINAFSSNGQYALVSTSNNVYGGRTGRYDLQTKTFTDLSNSVDTVRPGVINQYLWAGFETRHNIIHCFTSGDSGAHIQTLVNDQTAMSIHPNNSHLVVGLKDHISIMHPHSFTAYKFAHGYADALSIAVSDSGTLHTGGQSGYSATIHAHEGVREDFSKLIPGDVLNIPRYLSTHAVRKIRLSNNKKHLLRVHSDQINLTELTTNESTPLPNATIKLFFPMAISIVITNTFGYYNETAPLPCNNSPTRRALVITLRCLLKVTKGSQINFCLWITVYSQPGKMALFGAIK